MRDMSYEERKEALGRRIKGDMINTYKFLAGHDDVSLATSLKSEGIQNKRTPQKTRLEKCQEGCN